MTEKAYRGEITKSREDIGLSGYQYNMLDNASNNTKLDLTDEDGNLFVDPNLDKSDEEMDLNIRGIGFWMTRTDIDNGTRMHKFLGLRYLERVGNCH